MREYTSLASCTLVVNWSLTLLAVLSVVLVFSHKLVGSSMRVGAEDILILVSLLVGIVLVSLSTWTILEEGQGEHQQNVSPSQLERAAKSLLVAEALWSLVTGLLRTAACLLVHRIFFPVRAARRAAAVIIALSAGLAAASAVQIFLICRPFAAQWDPRALGSCGDQVLSFMVLESAGVVLDVGILVVPALEIPPLRIRTGRKVWLILFFNVGAVVLVITGLRMASLRKAVSPDFTYSQSYLSLLSAAGCMTGIICCAFPTMCALYNRVFHGLQSWWNLHRPDDDEEACVPSEPPEPPVRHPRAARTRLRETGCAKESDLESGSDSGPESGEESPKGTGTVGAKVPRPIHWEFCGAAIVLFDYDSGLEAGLPVVQGQLVWVRNRGQNGWLFAQDLRKGEDGLVPEDVLLSETTMASLYIA